MLSLEHRTEIFFLDVDNEIDRARQKFPNNKHMLAALVEEVGELAEALLKAKDNSTRYEIYTEAKQVVTMTARVATEGDPNFTYAPPQKAKAVYLTGIEEDIKAGRREDPLLNNEHLLATLMQRTGELSKKLLEAADNHEIYGAAERVGIAAARIATEGDKSFKYNPACEFNGCENRPGQHGPCALCYE